jgi:NADH-quinone oxidoreductase subunit J
VGDFGTVQGVALLLFTRYLYPFEITSVLLLAALVGTVILAKKIQGKKGEL